MMLVWAHLNLRADVFRTLLNTPNISLECSGLVRGLGKLWQGVASVMEEFLYRLRCAEYLNVADATKTTGLRAFH